MKECHILILQFEENHQKGDNDLFMIEALEFYTLYNELKETLAELQQNISEKLVIASSNMSKAVFKQEASEQKSQMAIYEQLIESIELGPNATLVKDIFNILNLEKQPVFKIQTDTSQNDPSNSKKAEKAGGKKQKLAKNSKNISHNIFSELQTPTEVPDKKDTGFLDIE